MKAVTKADFDFSKGAQYRKTQRIAKIHVRVAEEGEKIITHHSAGKETENTTKAGDYIIKTSDEDDGYIIGADRFFEVYEIDPENTDFYRNKEIRTALMTLDDVLFTSPWGEDMNALAGSMIIEAGPYIYAVDKFSFMRNYARAGHTPEHAIFAQMNEPLEVQLQKATDLKLENHIRDIELRMEHPHLFYQ